MPAREKRRRRRLRKLRFLRRIDPVFGPIRRRWQNSLPLRVITMTVVIASLLTLFGGTFILSSVREDLTASKLENALEDSARATVAAQRIIDSSDASDRSSLSSLMLSVRSAIRDISSSSLIYVRRQAGQAASQDAPLDFRTGAGVMEAVTTELSNAAATSDAEQLWQYVELPTSGFDTDTLPGIIVATELVFPAGIGTYDLFIGYSFAETDDSLTFITRTLVVTGVFTLIILLLLVWYAAVQLFAPIREAAEASKRLASGDAKARMEQQGDFAFDALSNNFNTMADTLSARISELDTLSVMQQRFVSDVSHELRTPLTTIRLASEVLTNSENLPPVEKRAASVMGEQLTRFGMLLDDLLEISRYDAGRVQLDTEPTSLVQLVQEQVEQLQPLSQSIIEVRPLGAYNAIEIDPRRISRIVRNLVGNAIEHGEGRPIIVTLDSNSSAVAITVRDYGIGMTEAQVDRVFDRFWRADPSRKRTLGGTGLGLAIAREDAEAHGGVLDVWSAPDAGANFRLTLPKNDNQDTFLSPLPLTPADVADAATQSEQTGWLDRPRRWLSKGGR
ncbi:MtrAB system histidine kinase MtrB [Canibacter zhoujuaniae]|uniref:MtrAB system histidine kinase MtrB n=1 Tax=Canibacter zhoujuaniae TaxID=2708343 RepID=UPI001422F5A3|nr:MtrAB system histidine kinase MtrB [Canibacter zhoujuaniae]